MKKNNNYDAGHDVKVRAALLQVIITIGIVIIISIIAFLTIAVLVVSAIAKI